MSYSHMTPEGLRAQIEAERERTAAAQRKAQQSFRLSADLDSELQVWPRRRGSATPAALQKRSPPACSNDRKQDPTAVHERMLGAPVSKPLRPTVGRRAAGLAERAAHAAADASDHERWQRGEGRRRRLARRAAAGLVDLRHPIALPSTIGPLSSSKIQPACHAVRAPAYVI